MCGKTGTAQVVGRRDDDADGDGEGEPIKDHAWFVAYAPERASPDRRGGDYRTRGAWIQRCCPGGG